MDSDKERDEVKPANALGKLSERSRSSRIGVVVISLIGFFLLVFLIGMIVRSVSNGIDNAPDIPRVDIL